MRIILAFALPPLAVLLCERPLHFILNLALTACFWIPGVVHALVIVQGRLYEKQTERTMRRMETAIAEHRPEVYGSLRRQRRHAAARQLLAGLALLLVGYVLSTGPVAWLIQEGWMSVPAADFIQAGYLPLHWLGQNFGWFGDSLKWYRRLTQPELPRSPMPFTTWRVRYARTVRFSGINGPSLRLPKDSGRG